MATPVSSSPRRAGVTAVHSLDRFVFSVPDLDAAVRFYDAFGLDVRRGADRIDLYTHGHPHRWGTVVKAPGRKKLQYLTFAVYADDLEALRRQAAKAGAAEAAPHPLADTPGLWLRDPDGTALQVIVADKASATGPEPGLAPVVTPPGKGAAPSRSKAGKVRPVRLSHVLLFSPDVPRSFRFYADVLGLRLSDQSGDISGIL